MQHDIGELTRLVSELLIPHPRFEQALQRLKQQYRVMSYGSEPVCLAIVGESRSGKSRVLEHFEHMHPPSRTEDGRTVPFLRATIPSKPLTSTLVEVLLYAIGDPACRSGTIARKTERLEKLLKESKTRVIALDEFQHFKDKGTQRMQHYATDWLKILVDRCKVGLVVTGLESSLSIIREFEQLRGRLMAPIRLGRFHWENAQDRADFIRILEAVVPAMKPFEVPDLANDGLALRCYCASGGLIGYLIKILQQATQNAIDTDTTKIRLEDLAQAYAEAVFVDEAAAINPFGPDFETVSPDIQIANAKQIGVPIVEERKPRKRTQRKVPALGMILSSNGATAA